MESRLVLLAQQGDRHAFDRVVLDMYARLHTVAYGILRDRELAEDAIQEAVLGVWRDLPALRDPSRFEAWSYRILVNACHAQGRGLRRYVSALADRLPERSERDPGHQAVVDRDQLERAFRRLSVDHRAVVVLRYYLELQPPEIAGILEIPVGTVHSRMHHALGSLRAAIEADSRPPQSSELPPEVMR